MASVVEMIAEKLRASYPELSLDEGRVVANAYVTRDMQTPTSSYLNNMPPRGYFDSTAGLPFLDSPQFIGGYCRKLVSEGFLCEHPSQTRMFRIADKYISVCDQILNGAPHI